MNERLSSVPLLSRVGTPVAHRWLRSFLMDRLARIQHGRISFEDGGVKRVFGSKTGDLSACVTIHRPRFYRLVALGGTVGAGESYMLGDWSCDDLAVLTRILLRNESVVHSMEGGSAWFLGQMRRLAHWLRRNTETGSRRNIADHYDLSNDFYRLFLDRTMMYSSGYFVSESSTLEEASVEKNDRLCRKLELQASDHLLEIGTGWGGFAVHAAKHYGCQVTTTTISRQQYEFARSRIEGAGLSGRVRVLLEDYRKLEGRFDKLVSIEMVEAVGDAFLDRYFQVCSRLLKPSGLMALQTITMSDQYFDRARKSVDFIKRYIFPGSSLPSVTRICQSVTDHTDLRLLQLEDISQHYARTLREWHNRFCSAIADVRALGFTDEFIRMWRFYLAYCEGGFSERYIGDVQMLLSKPAFRPSRPFDLLGTQK